MPSRDRGWHVPIPRTVCAFVEWGFAVFDHPDGEAAGLVALDHRRAAGELLPGGFLVDRVDGHHVECGHASARREHCPGELAGRQCFTVEGEGNTGQKMGVNFTCPGSV